jgi:hypothetical protein
MKQEEIIDKDEVLKMAVQAGYDEHQAKFDTRITAFAKLVEAKAAEREREAILDLVDAYAKNNTDLADAIRARGGA